MTPIHTDRPSVSVIMPTYADEPDRLGVTIRSVLDQTFEDFELIVVDDCSPKSPVAAIQQLGDPRITVERLCPNRGAAIARNHGTRRARGRFISYIDSDDVWYPEKLERQLQFIAETGAAFVYTRYDLMDEHGRIFGDSGPLPPSATYDQLLKHCFIRASSVMYDVEKVGGKPEFPDIRRRQDFGFFLNLLRTIGEARLLDESTCAYRIRHDSLAADKIGNIPFQWTVYRKLENLSPLKSVWLMFNWFTRAALVQIRRKTARALFLLARRLTPFRRIGNG